MGHEDTLENDNAEWVSSTHYLTAPDPMALGMKSLDRSDLGSMFFTIAREPENLNSFVDGNLNRVFVASVSVNLLDCNYLILFLVYR